MGIVVSNGIVVSIEGRSSNEEKKKRRRRRLRNSGRRPDGQGQGTQEVFEGP